MAAGQVLFLTCSQTTRAVLQTLEALEEGESGPWVGSSRGEVLYEAQPRGPVEDHQGVDLQLGLKAGGSNDEVGGMKRRVSKEVVVAEENSSVLRVARSGEYNNHTVTIHVSDVVLTLTARRAGSSPGGDAREPLRQYKLCKVVFVRLGL